MRYTLGSIIVQTRLKNCMQNTSRKMQELPVQNQVTYQQTCPL